MKVVVAHLGAIPEGEGRTFELGQLKLAIFRSRQGEVYATQADCPHRGGMLADGLLGGAIVVCPLHSQKFDLTNGRAVGGDCDLKTYPTHINAAGEIVVELNQ